MVLKPDVVAAALDEVSAAPGPRIYLTPRGRPLDQPLARQLAEGDGAVFLCGRYEGVDQRVIDAAQVLEVSIGDYILSGGEMAALTVLDAVVRLLPGRDRQGRKPPRGKFRDRVAGAFALHPPAELERNRGAGNSGVGPPPEDRRMASGGGEEGDADASTGFVAEVPARAGTGQQGEGIGR